jgi:uncharacterized membrane protein
VILLTPEKLKTENSAFLISFRPRAAGQSVPISSNRSNIHNRPRLINYFSVKNKNAPDYPKNNPKIRLRQKYYSGHHRVYKYNKNIPAYLAKGNFVTKMQIIAKAALTFLGISTLVNLCQNLSILTSTTQAQDTSTLRVILFFPVFIILLIAIVYLLIFKNDWLACKMAGTGEKLNPEIETLWLVGSLRMVAVSYGLILLSSSISTILNIVALPLHIRPLINEIFTFVTFPKSLIFTAAQWSSMIYNFLKALLAVYLLCGWPQFIRFQLNIHKPESVLNQNRHTEGIENE